MSIRCAWWRDRGIRPSWVRHGLWLAFDFDIRESAPIPPDTIHWPIAKHQEGSPPCGSSRGDPAVGLNLEASGRQMEGIAFMVMNGTWKTPVHGLVVSERRGWMEFRVWRKEGL